MSASSSSQPDLRARSDRRRPTTTRRSLRQLRRRAHELARASYADYLATLTEVYDAHGLDAAMGWSPDCPVDGSPSAGLSQA